MAEKVDQMDPDEKIVEIAIERLRVFENHPFHVEMGMMVIMMPFFFLAMYEKNGQPLEVILNNMIQAVFKRPKIRPYVTDNYYAALVRQAQAEMEVEKIVRLSQKEKTGDKNNYHAGGIKQSRPEGSKGNRKKSKEK